MSAPEQKFIRGKLIRDMSREELVTLHGQLEAELPDHIDKVTNADVIKMQEQEDIEDELAQRE